MEAFVYISDHSGDFNQGSCSGVLGVFPLESPNVVNDINYRIVKGYYLLNTVGSYQWSAS